MKKQKNGEITIRKRTDKKEKRRENKNKTIKRKEEKK